MISFKTLNLDSKTALAWGYGYGNNYSKEQFSRELKDQFSEQHFEFSFTKQIHSNYIQNIIKPGLYKEVDGLITQTNNLVLTAYTADCLPIIILEKNSKTISIVHAGWKGTRSKILLEAISQLKQEEKQNICIDFLPHICEKCYEVGPEFSEYFSNISLASKDNKLYFSLIKENLNQLNLQSISFLRENINYNNISNKTLCTFHSEYNLPSYRKQTKERIFNFCVLLSLEP